MTLVSELLPVLRALAARFRGPDVKSDLSPAVDVVRALGQLITRGSPHDIRSTQAAVAALREQLDLEAQLKQPALALTDINGQVYLAGALWAVNEVMSAQLHAVDANLRPSHDDTTTRRSRVERVVLEAMGSDEPQSPTGILQTHPATALGARRDEVSRALSTLMEQGLVVEVDSRGDRRRKFFTLTELGAKAQREAVEFGQGSATKPEVGAELFGFDAGELVGAGGSRTGAGASSGSGRRSGPGV